MGKVYRCALYARLSREDGDKPESDSIANQTGMLESYCLKTEGLSAVQHYTDDGYTGTNFDRPAFRRMMEDVDKGRIDCIVVKDLSRFGRDYIDTGRYLERVLPDKNVRFIAVNDNIDSIRGAYDMTLPIKNIFNSQYARDISGKIRSSLDTKRRQGEFIGAFCSYGYCKDAENRNRLVIDEGAARVVRSIFDMFEAGMGKDGIARALNDEGIPCPSEYKRLVGENYKNGLKLDGTAYWTYSTVHRILSNRMYSGDMVQGKYARSAMHGKAHLLDRQEWMVCEGTHEAIISSGQWNRVQRLLSARARDVAFGSGDPLKGFVKCGRCGRGMALRGKGDRVCYSCGSYERYGPSACPRNKVSREDILKAVLDGINGVLSRIGDIGALKVPESVAKGVRITERERLEKALERIGRLRRGVYEDYRDGILSKEDFFSYRADYEAKEKRLAAQLSAAEKREDQGGIWEQPWAKRLLEQGGIDALDRATVAETVESIYVYHDGRVEISYRFSEDASGLPGEEDRC